VVKVIGREKLNIVVGYSNKIKKKEINKRVKKLKKIIEQIIY